MLSTRWDGFKEILMFDNWPTLLSARLFDREAGFVAYHKKGMDILIDHCGGDETGTRACIVSDMYRKFLPKLKMPSEITVFDLGANGGGFPLMLRLEGLKIKKVVSVEANPLTFLRLQINLATNLQAVATALNAAVCGGQEGELIQFKAGRGSTSDSIFSHADDDPLPLVSVATITLQKLYESYGAGQPIDLCKIDIEAAEYEVIEATADSVLQQIRYLFIEFHTPEKTPQALAKLTRLGFTEIFAGDPARKLVFGDVRAFTGPKA